MKKNKRRFPDRWFWLTLLVPVAVLFSMTIQPLSALLDGEPITLQTVPVDPKDLFYGDYVDLKLAIEEVDASIVDPSLTQKIEKNPSLTGIPVYISLKPKGKTWEAVKVSESTPTASPYLKGKLRPYHTSVNNEGKKMFRIDYQIDRYYVEEGAGKELEELSRQGDVQVEVKVKNGYGVIVGVKRIH
ncbi:MAG: GDYXXLXY domain-containing protein [Thermoactinomyces sp.]